MAEQQGPTDRGDDWTGRIPGLGRLPARSRQLVLLFACLVLMVIMGLVIYLTPATSSGSTRGTPSAPVKSTAGSEPADPTIGGGEVTVEPSAPPETSSAPASPNSGSDEEDDHDHDHPAGPYGPDPTPVYSPSGTRSPESSDEKEGRELLDRVVPTWAEADFAAVAPDDAEDGNRDAAKRRDWIASWREEGDVKQSFVTRSSDQFVPLWDGAIQMGATVSDAKIIDAKLLWNSGSDAMWRVTVERTVSAPGISSTEVVSWDFQVAEGSTTYALVSFADTDPDNEDPKTYRPAP